MASTSSTDVDTKVQKALKDTRFETSALQKLPGGSVNFIYLAKLLKPLDDGTSEVLVKHGEPYMASKPDFALPPLRCSLEVESIKILSGNSKFGKSDSADAHDFVVRTPNFFYIDEESSTQIQELVPNGIDLKGYILEHYGAPTPESFEPQCRKIGKALGRWLKGFTEWSAKTSEHRELASTNEFGQEIRHMVNYSWLYSRMKEYPSVLGDVEDVFQQVEHMAAAERKEASKHQIIHGDFWPGNIVLPNVPIQESTPVEMLVIDWELTQPGLPSVDFGEMIAEMYALWLYKSITAGLWMMEGFVEGYGKISEDFAFRTAIQTGTHLLCVTTDGAKWGTPEQLEKVVGVGRDIIVHAWKKDRAWFEKGDLTCLFKGTRDS
ncbi:hypothetical protein NW762_001508 [Fusarium torreyae]|uniref:Aminoglycoside phosphotransferase domain-containing protein n=1 Tax=Fusarium torreyae TaxID=1237075 RepID=A0A9W8VP04_9HYPO|nr:hypothetical protein NW762_001508 [Fusarium torreyae]